MKDKIICYHCGGTLANWNKCEDPWIPHARYYPNCDFLRLVKGDDFIDEALNISGLGPRHKNTNIESVASGVSIFFLKINIHCNITLVCEFIL